MERPPDQRRVQPFEDEDQPRLARACGPVLHMHRRMHQMLHAVDRDGAIFAGDVEYPFDAEDLVAVTVQQQRQPDRQRYGGAELPKRLLLHL